MSANSRGILVVWTAICMSSAGTTSGQSTRARDATPLLTLGVPGASNTTPSLYAVGPTVMMVWTATSEGKSNIYLAMSNDGGAKFSVPRRVNDQDGDAGATNEQPPRVVISGSRTAPTVTVIWAKRDSGPQQTRRDVIRMARSTDGGRTFAPARFTHDPAFDGARGWQSVAADTKGGLHTVWLDGRDAARRLADSAKHTGMAHKGQPPQDVYHATLTPDGRVLETVIASDVCFCCKTAVAVDTRGTVYAAWRHIFPGSMRDIAFATSNDGGAHFNPVVRVSEDKWELNGCPEDGPSIAVDQSGTIHIAWSTVVADGADGELQKAIFYATSRDGKVFSPRKRLPTAAGSTPGHPQLVLLADRGVAIAFDEGVGSTRRVSLARLSPSGAVQAVETLSGDESAANPVIVRSSANNLLVAWTSRPASATAGASQIKLTRLIVR